MAITPVHATKTVTTAGTRVQLETDTSIKPSSAYFEASKANTGNIFIGLVTVTNAIYIACLAAGEGISFGAEPGGKYGGTGIQLSSFYADSSVNGEKVQVTYLYPTGG